MLVYCTKHEDYVSNIDVQALVDKQPTRKLIARKLMEKPLEEVFVEHPELVFDYKKIRENLQMI